MASGSDSTGASVPSALRPLLASDPRQIGPFRIAGRIGQGGMGTVYGALDGSGACIAVKAVARQFADDPEFRTAFAREIEAAQRVGGVCTPAVVSAAADAPVPWLATAYVPGPTLEAHVRDGGTLSGGQLTAFAAGLAEALTAVHGAGVVHSDVKPGNVILAPDGPKLVDFGVAEPAAAAARPGAPVFGSPGWLAPERHDGAAPAPSSDVFSWAAVVAFAATGRPPFGTGDTGERTRRSREEEADLDGAPAGLVPMLRAALAKDPAARPDAESIYRGLVDFTLDEDISAIPTPDLQSRLQGLLSRTWTGFGSTGHDPGAWVDALEPAPPGDGPGGPGDALGDAAADIAAETAAGAAASTGGVSGAASLGTIGAGKLTAVVSAAVIGTAGVGLGGMYAAGGLADDGPGGQSAASGSPSPSGPPSPKEAVTAVIDRFETTDSYLAREEAPPASAPPDFPDAEMHTEWVFRADPDIYQRYISSYTGHSTHEILDGQRVISQDRITGGGFLEGAETDLTLEAARKHVVAPFEEMSATMEVAEDGAADLDGTPARLIEGAYTGTAEDESGQSEEQELEFSLWLADEGTPLRLEYGPAGGGGGSGAEPEGAAADQQNTPDSEGGEGDGGQSDRETPEHRTAWVYSGFDGELDRWNCGTVEQPGGEEGSAVRSVLIATQPDVDCDVARTEAQTYVDTPPEELDGNALTGGDQWVCQANRPSMGAEGAGTDVSRAICADPADPYPVNQMGVALLPVD